MALRRLVAVIGFCFMLGATTIVAHLFFLLWLHGSSEITLYVDLFNERSIELVLAFLGFCFVPITVYEADALMRQ